jgi:hypothetical protein
MLQFNIMMKLFALLLGQEFEKVLIHKMILIILETDLRNCVDRKLSIYDNFFRNIIFSRHINVMGGTR